MKQSIRNTTIADRLLFLFLLGVSVSGIFIAREAVSQVSDVIIEVNGNPMYTYPINADRTVVVPGLYGDTVIEIKDRRVRVKDAHCPSRTCMKEGWVSKGVIVCLPNRIVVFVRGRAEKDGKQIDAVTG